MNVALKALYKAALLLSYLRAQYLKLLFKSVGRSVFIERKCKFARPDRITIGNNVYINFEVRMLNTVDITIGDYVIVGPNVLFLTTNIDYTNYKKPLKDGIKKYAPIVVEENVWIGASAIIMPGVTLGRGSIVGAGAVVTRDVSPFAVVGGVPARLIKYRFDKKKIRQALKVKFQKN